MLLQCIDAKLHTILLSCPAGQVTHNSVIMTYCTASKLHTMLLSCSALQVSHNAVQCSCCISPYTIARFLKKTLKQLSERKKLTNLKTCNVVMFDMSNILTRLAQCRDDNAGLYVNSLAEFTLKHSKMQKKSLHYTKHGHFIK